MKPFFTVWLPVPAWPADHAISPRPASARKMAFRLQPFGFRRSADPMTRAMARLTAAHALLFSLAESAADWPQFRGPNRDGAWNETGITESLPQGGLKI